MSEPNLFEFLKADADVAAVIADRIYPERIPQQKLNGTKTMDCCVVQLAGSDRQPKFCATDGLVGAAWQIDAYSPVRANVPTIARAIRRRLIDYSGAMGTAKVSRVTLDNEFSTPPDGEPGLFRRTMLFTIWFNEDE